MTFALKDLSVLLKDFDFLEKLMIASHKCGSLADIEDPRRRTGMLFLKEILTLVAKRINTLENTKTKLSKSLASSTTTDDILKCDDAIENAKNIYYGAMLVAITHAQKEMVWYESASKMCDNLAECIGINEGTSEENRPTPHDYIKFYTALNKYLAKSLFQDMDSRKGLRKDNFLTAKSIKSEHIEQLLNIGYDLEKAAHESVITKLTENDEASDAGTKYTIAGAKYAIKTPDSATAAYMPSLEQLARAQKELSEMAAKDKAATGKGKPVTLTIESLAWHNLQEELYNLVVKTCALKNKANPLELAKVSKERSQQLIFMQTVAALLNKSTIDDREKVAILLGTMHLVRQQIINKDGIKTGSAVLALLTPILKVDKTKVLDERQIQEVEAVVAAANQFVRNNSIVLVPPPEDKPLQVQKVISKTNPFKTTKGLGDLNLIGILNLFQEMIKNCRQIAVKQVFAQFAAGAKAEQDAAVKSKAGAGAGAKSSWSLSLGLGGLFGDSGASKVAASADNEEEAAPQELYETKKQGPASSPPASPRG